MVVAPFPTCLAIQMSAPGKSLSHFASFGDVPVLAKTAAQIAARRAKREHACSRQKMVQRLLLNRIDTKSAASAVGGQHHSIPHPLTHKTKSALPVIQFAKPRTQPAFDAPVRQHHPPACSPYPRQRRATGVIRLSQRCDHGRLLFNILRSAPVSSKYATTTKSV
jgi:hypothetical protein